MQYKKLLHTFSELAFISMQNNKFKKSSFFNSSNKSQNVSINSLKKPFSLGKRKYSNISQGNDSDADFYQLKSTKRQKLDEIIERTPTIYTHPKHNSQFQRIWTDGSCLNNGLKSGSIGGIGVYFGDDDPRNISEPLQLLEDDINVNDNLSVATNNKAELMAILKALEFIDNSMNVDIHTDSQYCINSLTVWIHNWKKKNWKNANNKPVQNKNIIQKIDSLISNRKGLTIFTYVKGHANVYENEQADLLAREGGLKAPK